MLCPTCQVEYEDGTVICPDCNEELIDELDEEFDDELAGSAFGNTGLVSVLISDNPAVVAHAKSLLEDAGIPYYEKDETGYNGMTELQVKEADADEAHLLLDEIEEDDAPYWV